MGLPTATAAPVLRSPQGLQDLLLYRCARLAATAGAVVVRLCEGRYGITRREWRMVALLGECGTMNPSQLAERAQLDRARTSRALSSLVTKGLVSRSSQAGDQRFARVALTEAGQALHAELFPQVARLNGALLGAMSDEDAVRLDALLQLAQVEAEALAAASDLPKAGRRRMGSSATSRA